MTTPIHCIACEDMPAAKNSPCSVCGSSAQSPADGGVAELVARLRLLASAVAEERWSEFSMRVPAEPSHDADLVLTRAAELLERLAPLSPIPVSERLPEAGHCDADGRCWLFSNVEAEWRLINTANPGVPHLKYCFSHWLPFNGLPLPGGEVAR